MFDWFKKKPRPVAQPLRDGLFGDVPLERWAGDAAGEPWALFRDAQQRLRADDTAGARRALEAVLALPGLESRHSLQAWHALRSIGVTPPAGEAKRVHGVVVEVHLDGGLDVLAGYEDLSARYLNHAGGATVWEQPGTPMDARITALLEASRPVVAAIGPWEGARPPPPPTGQARLSFLTPSGLHFGQAPIPALSREPMAAPVFAAATELMRALVEVTVARR